MRMSYFPLSQAAFLAIGGTLVSSSIEVEVVRIVGYHELMKDRPENVHPALHLYLNRPREHLDLNL
jgi:hypothetical protein